MSKILREAAGGTEGAGGGGGEQTNTVVEKLVDNSMQGGEQVNLSRHEYDEMKGKITDLTTKVEASKTDVEARKTLDTLASNVKKLYDPNQQNAEDAKGAYVELLQHAGYTKDDAEKEATTAFPPAEGGENQGGEQNNGEQQKPPPPSAEQLVLKQVIDRDIKDQVQAQMGMGDIKKILDFVAKEETKTVDGKEVDGRESVRYKGMDKHLRDSTESALRTRLVRLRDAQGITAMQTSVLQWIRDEASQAAEETAGKARLYVGDPNNLGRTPAGAPAGESPFDVLSPEPVGEPEFKENAEPGDKPLDKQVGDYMTDKLCRIAKKDAASL